MLCTKSKTYFHSCLASSPDFQLLPLETELSAFSNFHLKIFDSLSYEQKKKIESALTTNKKIELIFRFGPCHIKRWH